MLFSMQEERKRKKEEEESKRRSARAQKMAEFEKYKTPQKANFVISKKASSEDGGEVGITFYALGAYVRPSVCICDWLFVCL